MNSEAEPLRKRINTWVQTLGIVFAGVWGAYEFVYKDIYLPSTAPVNISLEIGLDKMPNSGSHKDDEGDQIVPVQITVSATNPSSRTVQLLPSQFAVFGMDVGKAADGHAGFVKRVTDDLNEQYSGKYQSSSTATKAREFVAGGSLFLDTSLNPEEHLSRTVVVYIDRDIYDKLEVTAQIPSARDTEGFNVKWSEDNGEPVEQVSWMDASGNVVDLDKDSEAFARISADKELTTFTARSEISLW